MAEFKIRSESLPSRCDICHQTDCFDAATGRCSRCEPVVRIKIPAPKPRNIRRIVAITSTSLLALLMLFGYLMLNPMMRVAAENGQSQYVKLFIALGAQVNSG